jgi:hypothetical protein
MSINFDEVRADLAAFADDDEEIILDRSGACVFYRGGKEISIQLQADDRSGLLVIQNDTVLPYKRFLSHELARLTTLAERILSKRQPVQGYVDSRACLDRPSASPTDARALELLAAECQDHPAFTSRVVFITADAGQGKTALLRQFQVQQARRFLQDRSPFLFWHVDLQGRQLLRLSEALLGDLGDLRVSGLWMSAIIRLLRHRALVLAIDGFDELAAEQGSADALGALALLVQQVGDSGTIVAASRRTFFDTDDYIRRANLFDRAGGGDAEFDQLSLQEWDAEDGRAYFQLLAVDGAKLANPVDSYDEVARELGQPDHPMLTRPFLLAQIARGILRYDVSPANFIKGMDDPLKGVGEVVRAFVRREVAEKWKQKDTGEPFLTEKQHLQLLADVAEEMFRSERTVIEIDVVEAIATLLLEEWNIETTLRPQIVEMVRIHVLLNRPDGADSLRSFDHEQFQDWFTAYAFKDSIERLGDPGTADISSLLSVAHLSDATARYVCGLIERDHTKVAAMLDGLGRLLGDEWRPSYLQANAGTLVPFLVDDVSGTTPLTTPRGIVCSSLVFEKSRLTNVRFDGATFVNVNLGDVRWKDITFINSELGELGIDKSSVYSNVRLENCHIEGLRLLDHDEAREYAPERIELALGRRDWTIAGADAAESPATHEIADGPARKQAKRVLNIFRRTTFLPESMVTNKFRHDSKFIFEEVLPIMEAEGVVESRPWRGSGSQRAWGLPVPLEDIERADGNSKHPLSEFWRRVDELDADVRRK